MDLKYVSLILLILAGLNWGLVALKGEDFFELYDMKDAQIMGKSVQSAVYTAFAAAALYLAFECFNASNGTMASATA